MGRLEPTKTAEGAHRDNLHLEQDQTCGYNVLAARDAARDADELSFRVGQHIVLHSKPEPEWWLGQLLPDSDDGADTDKHCTAGETNVQELAELLGIIGFFPSKYVASESEECKPAIASDNA